MSPTIGIRARPEQVADELAIRGLAYAFADSVNRRDASTFESLWDENGVWEIGAPLQSISKGAAAIRAHMIALAEPLEFFVQLVPAASSRSMEIKRQRVGRSKKPVGLATKNRTTTTRSMKMNS